MAINFLAGAEIDRAAHLRADEDWLRARLASSEARFLPLWRSRALVQIGDSPSVAFLARHRLAGWTPEDPWVFLGIRGETPLFAADLSGRPDTGGLGLGAVGDFQELRQVGALLGRTDGALFAYARAMLSWHRRHRHCGLCGGLTEVTRGGHLRRCPCGAEHFPRTDPAVIMLVERGDRCLLGRQASWPDGVYSTLAGFVEPGESLEEAVRREVFEESGVRVSRVTYHSSQPWPFPGSLMLGFHARADTEALQLDLEELEDARWWTREQIARDRLRGRLRLPSRMSIARRLVDDWLGDDPRP